MTGCSADYCINSSNKGLQMHKFPTNPERRKVWLDLTNRSDCVPGSHSALCNVHFTEDMYVVNANGKHTSVTSNSTTDELNNCVTEFQSTDEDCDVNVNVSEVKMQQNTTKQNTEKVLADNVPDKETDINNIYDSN